LAILPKDTIGIATYDSLFIVDCICKLLKLLHMAIQLSGVLLKLAKAIKHQKYNHSNLMRVNNV